MKRLVVEFEDDFHKRVKMEALKNDMSIKDYVKSIVEKDLETKKEQTS